MGLGDAGKIIYDALTFNNSIDAMKKAENAMKKASASMESLKSYMSNTPEAGGGLSAGGSTVAGLIAQRATRTTNLYNILVDGRKKLEKARDILGGFGTVFNIFTGGLYGALKGLIVRGSNGISEFLDGLVSGDPDAILGGAFDVGGAFVEGLTEIANVSNVGDMYDALQNASDYSMSITQDAADAYHRGEIGLGETLGTGTGSALGATVGGFTDAVSNFFGVDIPDSVTNAIVDGGAAAGRWVGQAIDTVSDWLFG